jgi:hypothetical protein
MSYRRHTQWRQVPRVAWKGCRHAEVVLFWQFPSQLVLLDNSLGRVVLSVKKRIYKGCIVGKYVIKDQDVT